MAKELNINLNYVHLSFNSKFQHAINLVLVFFYLN
jgi:hypothetical protein